MQRKGYNMKERIALAQATRILEAHGEKELAAQVHAAANGGPYPYHVMYGT